MFRAITLIKSRVLAFIAVVLIISAPSSAAVAADEMQCSGTVGTLRVCGSTSLLRFKKGGPIGMSLGATNLGQSEIMLSLLLSNRSNFVVRDAVGNEPETIAARLQRECAEKTKSKGSETICQLPINYREFVSVLKPGASGGAYVSLSRIYDLDQPGTYEVEFFLDNFRKIDPTSDIKPLKIRFEIVA